MDDMRQEFQQAKKQLDHSLDISPEDLTRLEERVMQKIRHRKRPLRRLLTAVAALFILGFGLSIALHASSNTTSHLGDGPTQPNKTSEPRPGDTLIMDGVVQKYGAYVIHNNAYYSATGQEISETALGDKIGPVKRVGIWIFKREGDSNYYVPNITIMYQIKNIAPDQEIALKIRRNSLGEKVPNDAYKYEIFKKVAPVEKPDTTKILDASGDMQEVQYAIQNIKRVNPHFFSLNGLGLRATPFLARYTPGSKGSITTLNYTVNEATEPGPEAPEGTLVITEYSEMNKTSIPGNLFWPGDQNIKVLKSPPPQKEFDLNGIHWKKYSNFTYLGQKGDQYYEIRLSGIWSDDLFLDFLHHFSH